MLCVGPSVRCWPLQKAQIFELLKKNLVFFLATVEGTELRVRGMLLYKADESGVIFPIGSRKEVYHQIMENSMCKCASTL